MSFRALVDLVPFKVVRDPDLSVALMSSPGEICSLEPRALEDEELLLIELLVIPDFRQSVYLFN